MTADLRMPRRSGETGSDRSTVRTTRLSSRHALSGFVDHLRGRVAEYDRRFKKLKLRLTSKGRLNSFLKFGTMPELRRFQALPMVDSAASPRVFVEQECLADRVWVSLPSRDRKPVFCDRIFTAHSVWQPKQHDLGNHATTLHGKDPALLSRRTSVKIVLHRTCQRC
jgi:hypothetical protein